ncbi:Zinc finger CCCH domain-containing protein 3 [Spatholobus suberectus]|nr:Zinc finger CCCH domain-containing protein 3 [Spatholobus suberectus]
MPVRKYYCDYCDKQFQDTPADRKRHVQGIQHQQAKARWYDSFKKHQQIPPIPNPNPPLCFHFVNTVRYGTSIFIFIRSNLVLSLTLSMFRDFAVTATLANISIPFPTTTYSRFPQS